MESIIFAMSATGATGYCVPDVFVCSIGQASAPYRFQVDLTVI